MNWRIAVGGALLTAGIPAQATMWIFTIDASGPQVVPASSSTGTGHGTLTYDDQTNVFSLDMTMTGITAPAASDITSTRLYAGSPGSNGSMIDDLSVLCNWNGSSGNFGFFAPVQYVLSQSNEAALLSGGSYLQINTVARPSGEIRGQFNAVPEPATWAVIGLGLLALARKRWSSRA